MANAIVKHVVAAHGRHGIMLLLLLLLLSLVGAGDALSQGTAAARFGLVGRMILQQQEASPSAWCVQQQLCTCYSTRDPPACYDPSLYQCVGTNKLLPGPEPTGKCAVQAGSSTGSTGSTSTAAAPVAAVGAPALQTRANLSSSSPIPSELIAAAPPPAPPPPPPQTHVPPPPPPQVPPPPAPVAVQQLAPAHSSANATNGYHDEHRHDDLPGAAGPVGSAAAADKATSTTTGTAKDAQSAYAVATPAGKKFPYWLAAVIAVVGSLILGVLWRYAKYKGCSIRRCFPCCCDDPLQRHHAALQELHSKSQHGAASNTTAAADAATSSAASSLMRKSSPEMSPSPFARDIPAVRDGVCRPPAPGSTISGTMQAAAAASGVRRTSAPDAATGSTAAVQPALWERQAAAVAVAPGVTGVTRISMPGSAVPHTPTAAPAVAGRAKSWTGLAHSFKALSSRWGSSTSRQPAAAARAKGVQAGWPSGAVCCGTPLVTISKPPEQRRWCTGECVIELKQQLQQQQQQLIQDAGVDAGPDACFVNTPVVDVCHAISSSKASLHSGRLSAVGTSASGPSRLMRGVGPRSC